MSAFSPGALFAVAAMIGFITLLIAIQSPGQRLKSVLTLLLAPLSWWQD